jgi:undecaprenyl diphosphate synthase
MEIDIKDRISKERMPTHLAVITDGNGRWAKKRKLKRVEGHREGIRTVRKIVEASVEIGLEYLTIYAFSTENWRRSKAEVNAIFRLIMDALIREVNDLNENNVVIKFIGSPEKIPSNYSQRLHKHSQITWDNTGLKLNVAINYGGRKEIVDAVNKIIQNNDAERLGQGVSEEMISNALYTAGMPDPDMIIRTGGENRLSNFLVWQSIYAELWFTQTLWPDFSREEYFEAILDYQNRERRFGAR